MITYSGNIQVQENKNNAAANNSDKEAGLLTQNKLQASVNGSQKIQQLKTYQAMADATSKTTQREAKPEEEMLQGKFTGIQREAKPEEEMLQGKFATIQQVAGLEEEPVQGKFNVVQRQENNTGMPDSLKSGVENLSGMDLSDVKVHYNSDKPAQMQALAYAQGSDIHIGPGQEKHLPHEAWHVVQQRQGRVQPTMQMKGTAVNDDPGLEHEADVMGAKAVQMKTEGNQIIQYQKPFYQCFKSIDAAGNIYSHQSPVKYRSHAEGRTWIGTVLAGLPGHRCHGKPTILR